MPKGLVPRGLMPSGHVFVNQLSTGQVSGIRMPSGHVARGFQWQAGGGWVRVSWLSFDAVFCRPVKGGQILHLPQIGPFPRHRPDPAPPASKSLGSPHLNPAFEPSQMPLLETQ